MQKLLDLRLLIGVFFAIIGSLLLGYAYIYHEGSARVINVWCGGLFLLFGTIMILLAIREARSRAGSE